MPFNRFFLYSAALLGLSGVVIGAFGAHALPKLLGPTDYAQAIAPYKTGVEYHFYHSLVLLAVAFLPANRLSKLAGWFFIIGIVLFSFSLYALALSGIKMFGAITPFGGILMILGWLMLMLYAWRAPKLT